MIEAPVWLNGQPQAFESNGIYQNRGLHYGDGVFRTLLKVGGEVVDMEGQVEHLLNDARALGMASVDHSLLAKEINAASASLVDSVLKVMLTRIAGGRGYRPAADRVDRLILSYPVPQFPATHWQHGIVAMRATVALAEQPRLAGIKHLNRLEQVLASRDWPAHADELLHEDCAGRVVCGNRSNLFWASGGVLYTPELSRCGIAGRTRARLLAFAAHAGLSVKIQDSRWEDLLGADEAFVANSVIGIWPLRRFEDRVWKAPGAATRTLQGLLKHPLSVGA